MFTNNRLLGVNGKTINMSHQVFGNNGASVAMRSYKGRDDGSKVKLSANVVGSSGGGGASMSVNGFWQSNYQYYMTGIIPADPHLIDTSTLALFYRDIYMFDSVGGSVVDILSHFPFSSWELRGLDAQDLKPFNDALERLNIQTMLPLISTAHLTDGFFCGSLVFDPKSKQFIDTMLHDALSCAVIPSPFFGIDPTINVRVGQATQQFMHDTSEYARRYLQQMPHQFVDMLKSGAFTLDPVTTMFIPRRSTTDRAYTSFLHRILPMYLIEKTLFRGTLVETQRRQRAMTHLTAGDDTWTPTSEELNQLVQSFQQAEYDPLGGWISTRNAVQAVDLRPGGDFFKFSDMADIFVPYKLRALGASESFMSQEACLIGSTQIKLQNGTTTSIESLSPIHGLAPHELKKGQWFPLNLELPNRISNSAKTEAWSYQGYRETFTVTTEDGKQVTGTENHPFFVLCEDGTTKWKRLDELKEGDLIAVDEEEQEVNNAQTTVSS